MQLDLQCVKCEESFSLDFSDVSNDAALLKCPGCGAKAPEEQVELVVTSLEELFGAIAALRLKFSTVVELNSEDLPPPYDEAPIAAKKAALLDADDDEEGSEEEEELEDEHDERESEL